MHHGPAVADALDVSMDVKVPDDAGGTVAAAGSVHALYRQRTRLRWWLQPAHHGSARPAVLRALSCNAVVVAWLYPAAAACTGCALCAVRCPFDAIRMVRTQPLIEDV